MSALADTWWRDPWNGWRDVTLPDWSTARVPRVARVARDITYGLSGTLRAGTTVVVTGFTTNRSRTPHGQMLALHASVETPLAGSGLEWTHRDDGIANLSVPASALEGWR